MDGQVPEQLETLQRKLGLFALHILVGTRLYISKATLKPYSLIRPAKLHPFLIESCASVTAGHHCGKDCSVRFGGSSSCDGACCAATALRPFYTLVAHKEPD